jgi:hypothetical protein
LVKDAQATLDAAVTQAGDPEVRAGEALLTKILPDDLPGDVTTDEASTPRIGEVVAADRIISLAGEEMRHRRKSASRLFDGPTLPVKEKQNGRLVVARHGAGTRQRQA